MTSPMKCAHCDCSLDTGAKEIPFLVTDAFATGDKTTEPWCPQCFCYVRAPQEPERFHAPSFVPVHCGRCGMTSVDSGRGQCSQCGNHVVKALPPKKIEVEVRRHLSVRPDPL